MSRSHGGRSKQAALKLEDPPVSVELRRSRGARRISLSVSHIDGAARLTAPADCSDAALIHFLNSHRDWLRKALRATPEIHAIADGGIIPFSDKTLRIQAAPDARGVRLLKAKAGEQGLLQVGGPTSQTGRRTVLWLREQARARLLERSQHYADALGESFSKISIRDTRSRWGSCSSNKALSFSWRLIFAPSQVLDYVSAHEVAHLREMNHSQRFWDLVEQLKPDWKEDRDWLRQHGAELHRYQAF